MFMNEPKMFDTDVADSSDGPRSPILLLPFLLKKMELKKLKLHWKIKLGLLKLERNLTS